MKVFDLLERDEDTNDVPGKMVVRDDGSIVAYDKLGNKREFIKGDEKQAHEFANGAGATVLDEMGDTAKGKQMLSSAREKAIKLIQGELKQGHLRKAASHARLVHKVDTGSSKMKVNEIVESVMSELDLELEELFQPIVDGVKSGQLDADAAGQQYLRVMSNFIKRTKKRGSTMDNGESQFYWRMGDEKFDQMMNDAQSMQESFLGEDAADLNVADLINRALKYVNAKIDPDVQPATIQQYWDKAHKWALAMYKGNEQAPGFRSQLLTKFQNYIHQMVAGQNVSESMSFITFMLETTNTTSRYIDHPKKVGVKILNPNYVDPKKDKPKYKDHPTKVGVKVRIDN